MRRSILLPLMIAAAAAAAPVIAEPSDGSLRLNLDLGARSGQVMIALFDSPAAYNGQGAPVRQVMVDASGDPVAVFEGLPAGRYAAKMFHDVNGDGQMNMNPFGQPVEPYAFTNNAVGNMGPAGWDRAGVEVNGAVEQTIRLR
ncbi:DUF2141 domain-containing protein [Brevundimonas balnearis]|uniref:DUF2141 domain-containing protein n=1 Tax=Brevundimonas balnearis TaxID=1572858 RepID=A0ABV6R328_9CAUL